MQVNVRVTTMDAELEFAIQPNTTGKQLFDQVGTELQTCTAQPSSIFLYTSQTRLRLTDLRHGNYPSFHDFHAVWTSLSWDGAGQILGRGLKKRGVGPFGGGGGACFRK